MRFFYAFLLFLYPLALFSEENYIPRTIIVLYDKNREARSYQTTFHRCIEVVLNHLGLDAVYYNAREELPNLDAMPEVRGIISDFSEDLFLSNPETYLNWASHAVDIGKKYVFLRDLGFKANSKKIDVPIHIVNEFLKKIGLQDKNEWIGYTFNYKVSHSDKELYPFEKTYPTVLPSFPKMQTIGSDAKAIVSLAIPDDVESRSDVVVVSSHGGYIAADYGLTYWFELDQPPAGRHWYINPFRFFQMVFETENLPIPDVTTLAGRRIFYSQVDGDAFNSITQIEEYTEEKTSCAEVLYNEIFTEYSSLPITVSLIAADVDPNWVGSKKAQAIAKKILKLPNVEVASHTYSHPFEWEFFADSDIAKEISFLHRYPYGSWQSSFLSWFRSTYYKQFGKSVMSEKGLSLGYTTPRAYANEPFDIVKEIYGSIDYVKDLAPEDKKVAVIQWSGNCFPWDVPIRLSRERHVRNINGGDSKFDAECPSYSCLSPIGRKSYGQQQIYSSMNNENVYTYDWTDRFYGFKYLIKTLINTESPLRIKPIDLYYHFYSGEKSAALNAVKDNITWIQKQETIPLWTSRFCAIADGFFTIQIKPIAERSWQLYNREGLDTIRLDPPFATDKFVDFRASKGVIGARRHQDCLYVYLDAFEKEPLLTLSEQEESPFPYLVSSSWEIWNLEHNEEKTSFKARGWGPLKMSWRVPSAETLFLTATLPDGKTEKTSSAADGDRDIHFSLDLPYDKEIEMVLAH